jgi:hypothetical protein
MPEDLPENLSVLDSEVLADAREARDRKIAPLFRRWPKLTSPELRELRRLYEERVRLARHWGALRRRRLKSRSAGNVERLPRGRASDV